VTVASCLDCGREISGRPIEDRLKILTALGIPAAVRSVVCAPCARAGAEREKASDGSGGR